MPSIQARNTNQTDNLWWSASALADHRKLYICLMPEMYRIACHCIDMRFDAFHTITICRDILSTLARAFGKRFWPAQS